MYLYLIFRSLDIKYVGETTYQNIPVSIYNTSLGDMSKNLNEKCYCPTPTTCLRKGAIDLEKCSGAPIIVTLPHFYDADNYYLKGIRGLKPDIIKHGVQFYFETVLYFFYFEDNCK